MACPSHYFDELLIHHRLPLAAFRAKQSRGPRVVITNAVEQVVPWPGALLAEDAHKAPSLTPSASPPLTLPRRRPQEGDAEDEEGVSTVALEAPPVPLRSETFIRHCGVVPRGRPPQLALSRPWGGQVRDREYFSVLETTMEALKKGRVEKAVRGGPG
jgi:hypothetical protein